MNPAEDWQRWRMEIMSTGQRARASWLCCSAGANLIVDIDAHHHIL